MPQPFEKRLIDRVSILAKHSSSNWTLDDMTAFVKKGLEILWRRKCEERLVMLGIQGSGKTTLLYKLLTGETLTTVPTMGFNRKLPFLAEFLGTQLLISPKWKLSNMTRSLISSFVMWVVLAGCNQSSEISPVHGLFCFSHIVARSTKSERKYRSPLCIQPSTCR